jgi:hypothetical protein
MATVSIISWREDGATWSGWAGHARSEFRRRLRRSVSLSPAAYRTLERQVRARELVAVQDVALEQAHGLRQILEALGANVVVDPAPDV